MSLLDNLRKTKHRHEELLSPGNGLDDKDILSTDWFLHVHSGLWNHTVKVQATRHNKLRFTEILYVQPRRSFSALPEFDSW